MIYEFVGQEPHTEGLTSFLSTASEIFSDTSAQWEHCIESGLKLLGESFDLDQVEIVIHSLDKRNSSLITWNKEPSSKGRSNVEEQSELIAFLFKNQKEDFLYYKDIDREAPAQLKKVLILKRMRSALLFNLKSGERIVGYLTAGFVQINRSFNPEQIKLVSTFISLVSNYLVIQQQSATIKRLVEKNAEQDRRLKEFAFITSHHLRAFSSNLSSLTEYLMINPNEQRFIEMISNSVKKLNVSVEDINEILTHENDLITEELSRVKISAVITKILGWHKKAISANRIEVENLVPKRLSINCKLEMLENIFSHIFSNAIKYGTNNKSKKIRIDHSANDEYLIVRIRDFGEGIDMKKYGHKLFKAGSRFSQNSNSNLGMGLFLSKYQIQKIGGRIHLKSEPGKGTSVQCYLPLNLSR